MATDFVLTYISIIYRLILIKLFSACFTVCHKTGVKKPLSAQYFRLAAKRNETHKVQKANKHSQSITGYMR